MNPKHITELNPAEMIEVSGGTDIEINWSWIGDRLREAGEFIQEVGEQLTN